MKWIRDNLTYIFLGLVALVLIFVTISLQSSILATQPPAAADTDGGFVAMVRRQVAAWILPNSADPSVTTAPSGLGGATGNAGPMESTGVLSTELLSPSANGSDALPADSSGTGSAITAGSMAAALYNAQNLTISEDNEILTSIIETNRNAVGFFHHAYYLANQERLRAVAIRLPSGELVPPDATTVAAGLYPLARPLYLYTSPTVIRANPAVEALLGCFLNRLPEVVGESGYLLPSRTLFAQAVQSFDATCQRCRREATTIHPLADVVPTCDFADVPIRDLMFVGGASVTPLASQVAALSRAAGYGGDVTVAATTTGAGFEAFCGMGEGDLVAAGRVVTSSEREICRATDRSVLPFPVAVDALTVVVNSANSFLQNATIQELQQIFAYARTWSEVNPAWPNEPIVRALPGGQSGSFAYFVEAVMEEGVLATLAERRAQPLAHPDTGFAGTTAARTSQPAGVARAIARNQVGTELFIDKSPLVRLGAVGVGGERGPECAAVTELMALVLEGNFGLQVEVRTFPDADELFATLSAKDRAERVDMTFCYLDPLDRSYRQRYFGYTEFIDSGYLQIGENRLVIMTNSVVKPALERENRCLYQFLDTLNLETVPLTGEAPVDWYEQNQATIEAWLPCES